MFTAVVLNQYVAYYCGVCNQNIIILNLNIDIDTVHVTMVTKAVVVDVKCVSVPRKLVMYNVVPRTKKG